MSSQPRASDDRDSALESAEGIAERGADSVTSPIEQGERFNRRKPRNRGDLIAVIGQSGRYPGANNLDEFWENLAAGRDSIVEVPAARWNVARYFDPQPRQEGKTYSKWLGALDDIDCFDPAFFNISPAEAELMDPQHRLFLQEAYRAFEDAGYSRSSLSNANCGVYLGIMHNEYGLILQKELGDLAVSMLTSSSFSIAAARIAYYLNLKGPAISVDTACSSSLVAMHLACQALWSHEVDMALAGGVTLYLMAESYVGMSAAGMLSPQGRCKAFDDSADGIVPGEGVAALVLKRLSDAEAANDIIHGVVIASAINQDGRTNGITAPSLASQVQLVRDLYRDCDIDPQTLQYVEMHGTGTKMGDPIELQALTTAFRERTSRRGFCAIGSVKSNLGHTSAAAGMAGVQKVLLSLRHGYLPPTLHFNTPNRLFKFTESPFVVNGALRRWSRAENEPLRRAAISSFGMSGTNAHVVVEEYVAPGLADSSRPAPGEVAIILSARDEDRLRDKAAQLLQAVRALQWNDVDLPSIAYTLQACREPMEVRVAFTVASLDDMRAKLERFTAGEKRVDGLYRGEVKRNKEMLEMFAGSEDLKGVVAKWAARRKYVEILKLWVRGLAFDWRLIHGDRPPRRVSLPTYPFAKERYWVRPRETAQLEEYEEVWVEERAEPRRSGTDLAGLSVDDHVLKDLKEHAGALLKRSPVALTAEDNFGEFGFDSIGLAQYAKRLSAHYGFEVNPGVLFNQPTLAKLQSYLLQQYSEQLSRFYRFDSTTEQATSRRRVRRKVRRAVAASAAIQVPEPIAIIGMSGRFPQARSVQEFWELLAQGRDAVSEIPPERFDWRAVYGASGEEGKSYCKWLGCVPGVEEFDPLFFEISPREAQWMDPRQRLLLQESWRALEDAGYGPDQLQQQKIGVFVGVEQGDYQLLCNPLPRSPGEGREGASFSGSITSNHDGILASRLAYFLNLHGPTMALNTACSSGLVAAHQACLSLRAAECETAIVGAVNLLFTPQGFIGMSQAGMLSAQGQCRAFDERADGMVPGEAVVAVILKRLSQAQRDGDPIDAVIRGSGINYDGKTNGITAPSGVAQQTLLQEVYARSGVSPKQIEYIVTHGTGTKLGDPIEINALNEAFKGHSQETGFCALTSTKSNVGHTLAASGLVSLVGLVQAMRHELIPGSLHCEQENAYIEWQASPFYVNKAPRAWPKRPEARYGAVSAFGMSGTNAHMVISSFEPSTSDVTAPPSMLLMLSGKTEAALQQRIMDLLQCLQQECWEDRTRLLQMSHTLLTGRQHFAHRAAVVITDRQQALLAWQTLLDPAASQPNVFKDAVPRGFKAQQVLKQYAESLIDDLKKLESDRAQYQSTLHALADLYCQGYELPWSKVSADWALPRIHLPSYPFAQDRHWVPARVTETFEANEEYEEFDSDAVTYESWDDSPQRHPAMPEHSPPARASSDATEVMTFEEVWTEQPVDGTQPVVLSHIVCFASASRLQRAIAGSMVEQCPGVRVSFIDRTSQDDLGSALRKACGESGRADALLYLWPLEENVPDIESIESIARVIQGIAGASIECPRLILAGEFATDIDRAYLESWIGFERSSGLVLPNIRISVVLAQTEAVEIESSAKRWIDRLWRELQASKSQSSLYLDGKRHVCRIQRTQVQPVPSSLRHGGTYLITGGAGALGLMFARHLAKTHAARLILTGRSPLDEHRQQKLAEIRQLGGDAVYVQADACDSSALRSAVEIGQSQFGALHGVILAAGLEGREDILTKSIEQFSAVLAPKISGALVLHEVLSGLSLDFICYFSSSSAILGDFGSCDYAIGNRFQMACAQYVAHSFAERAIAINWPLWKDGGMAQGEADSVQLYLKSSGQRALEREEGLALFEQLLASKASHQLVIVGQPARVHRFLKLAEAEPASPPPTDVAVRRSRSKELQGLGLAECVLHELRTHAGELLQISPDALSLQANLGEFGFDSIGLAQYAKRLSAHYGFEIKPGVFFNHPTLAKLQSYLLQEYPSQLSRFYHFDSEVRETPVASVRRVRRKVRHDHEASSAAAEPIAIIGMSGRFPQARTVQEFWELLAQGRDAVSEIPPERFDWRATYGANGEEGKSYCKWLGCVPGVDEFDPVFFEISPREAQWMDPRQRLLLQESWRALEDAGYGPDQLQRQKIGVFVGVEQGDYQLLSGQRGSLTSNHDGILASRLAYFLNLRGPTMALNTTCSSGLVAAHQACLSLRAGECDTAAVGAVNLLFTPQGFISMSQAGMLSAQGRCRAFDEQADGMVPGEAVVAVILKRLSRAQSDNDPIDAVIRGSGINYDGKTNGITAPSGIAQQALLQEVYARCGVSPKQIEYIVTHGTGTRLGDPIEISALNEAFKGHSEQAGFCALTSTKSNVGHTLAASGLVSLVGLVQAMRNELIPGSLHCEQENAYIEWQASPFYVNKAPRPWLKRSDARYGAVSAFGMSGTNAHMVVSSFESAIPEITTPPSMLLMLSGKTEAALQQRIMDLLQCLQQECWDDRAQLLQMSHTLLTGRQHFTHRAAVVIADRDQAQLALQALVGTSTLLPHAFKGQVPREFKGQRVLAESAECLLDGLGKVENDREQYRQTLCALGDLYCQGYELTWSKILAGRTLSRIHLPAYPFADEHYWVDASDAQSEEYEEVWIEERAAPKNAATDLKGLSVEDHVLKDLREHAGALLKRSPVALTAEDNFGEFGFDSIGLAQYAKRLSAHYGFEIKPGVFFNHPTLARLRSYLLQQHPAQLSQFYHFDGTTEQATSRRRVRRKVRRAVAASAAIQVPEPIAIIGMSGRFPQARSVQEFWELLAQGRDAVSEIPPERFDWRAVYGASGEEGKSYCKWLGCVPGVEEFDPLFFEISPREAQWMDPRQRLLLQESWRALEDAGYGPDQLQQHKIGVFVGVEQGDYQLLCNPLPQSPGEGREGASFSGSITSNHDGILASRLAYFLNLHGPTMALNTACSSGLVAAHQACLSLRAAECETAIVGAVNLLFTPQGFIGMSQAGMLSAQGQCRAFDERADGMVPGEAVVAVILKRLSQAQRDGDPIDAVIRGSGINYDGKTNGITAPSGVAQQTLLQEVYARSGVSPKQIEYIVTHGTGTKLGDPIEINALNEAFKGHSQETGFCALTSTKSNVGHTLAASGLVSLVGLVQAMRHELIPGSLHCEQENAYIEWQASPFYVNKAPRAWPKRPEARYGAVSAFGMSGTNAHMVVSSFESSMPEITAPPSVLLMLSGKTEAALQQRINDLLQCLQQECWEDRTQLLQMSHTLLTGRQHFAHRAAVVIADRQQALLAWQALLKSAASQPNVFKNVVPQEFKAQQVLKQYAESLIDDLKKLESDRAQYQSTLHALADLHCQGYELPWSKVSAGWALPRIHLPSYPFAQDRHWASAPKAAQASVLHPLLHANTSDLNEQRYSSHFTGEEFFLNEHRVHGRKVLPGVAYLEMARAALMRAIPRVEGTVQLRDVVWLQPFLVDQEDQASFRHSRASGNPSASTGWIPAYAGMTSGSGSSRARAVHIALSAQDDGTIGYEIYSSADASDAEAIVHAQGRAEIVQPSPAAIDIPALRARCTDTFTADQVYEQFDRIGLNYGPALRAIERLQLGTENGRSFVLAQLKLANSIAGTHGQYELHPSLLDGGLQACMGLVEDDTLGAPALPFALESLQILHPCPPDPLALVRIAPSSTQRLRKFDVQLCTADGKVCVVLQGFTAKVAAGEHTELALAASNDLVGDLTLVPEWVEVHAHSNAPTPTREQCIVIAGGSAEQRSGLLARYPDAFLLDLAPGGDIVEQLESCGDIEHLFWIAPSDAAKFEVSDALLQHQEHGVMVCFGLIKALLTLGYEVKNLALTIITTATQAVDDERMSPVHASVHGFIGSLAKEYSHWRIRLIDLQHSQDWPLEQILVLPADPKGDAFIRRGERWYRQQLASRSMTAPAQSRFRTGGVYVLIGGAGGIGEAFSEYLIRKYQARIVWIGRRAAAEEIERKRQHLSLFGEPPQYICADATDRASLQSAYLEIKSRYPSVHGVVHGAIALLDSGLRQMDEERFRRGFAAKAATAVRLAQVFGNEPLDFVLFMSSLVSFTKAPGQSNYAAGCAFQDAFARQWARDVPWPVKIVNWGYWGSVGVGASDQLRQRMDKLGLGSVEPEEGMAALEFLLAGPYEQLAFVKTTTPGLAEALGVNGVSPRISSLQESAPVAAEPTSNTSGIETQVRQTITEKFAQALQLRPNDIHPGKAFADYGLDSIVGVRLSKTLSEALAIELPSTTLFAYPSINELTAHVLDEHREALAPKQPDGTIQLSPSTSTPAQPTLSRQRTRRTQASERTTTSSQPAARVSQRDETIAIVGVAGRMPQSNNLEEFWSRLAASEDLVVEIPPTRWSLDGFYEPDVERAATEGKSYNKWGGFLGSADGFDYDFFPEVSYLPITMHERHFLEVVWSAIESAGYTLKSLQESHSHKVGVYVGSLAGGTSLGIGTIATSTAKYFDCRGPCIAMDTMSASALYAIHLACDSLRRGECEAAIIGGVNLLSAQKFRLHSWFRGMGTHRDSRCYTNGDGLVIAECVGAALLKPLSKAIADGDCIRGIVRSTVACHTGGMDGKNVPNLNMLSQIVVDCLREEQIDPRTISYMETAATGLRLADQFEIMVMSKAFRQFTSDRQFCRIGTVKSNIGHAEGASAMAQLMKVLLQMEHRQIIPLIKLDRLDPELTIGATPFQLQQALEPWERPIIDGKEHPRRALINSLGVGGTFACMIVDEYMEADDEQDEVSAAAELIVLSAKNPERLQAQVMQLIGFLKNRPRTSLQRLAWTLQVGREAMSARLAVIASSIDELIASLQQVSASDQVQSPLVFTQELPSGEIENTVELSSECYARRDLPAFARCWVTGGSVSWERLVEKRPKRMPLPTYPFAKTPVRNKSLEY